jgi:hypothetical protein
MSKPWKDTLITALLIVLGGIAYYLIAAYTPFGLPCLYKLTTGLKCPSCGVTHMFINLSHFRFREAYADNGYLFFAWLPTVIEVLYIRYMSSAKKKIPKWNYAFVYALCGGAIAFGILRNIY